MFDEAPRRTRRFLGIREKRVNRLLTTEAQRHGGKREGLNLKERIFKKKI